MKRHVQEPGIRKWSGDDLLELQGEPLSVLDQFFEQYGNMVIKGCEIDIEAGTVSAGLVAISGKDVDGKDTYKVCPFRGTTGIEIFPVFLALKFTEFTREYDDTVVRPIAYRYEAELLQVKPVDRPYLELNKENKVRFVDIIQDSSHRFISDEDMRKWNEKSTADHTHPVATKEKAGFMGTNDREKMDKLGDIEKYGDDETVANKIIGIEQSLKGLDGKFFETPTLSFKPTETTMTYQYKEEERTFLIGQQCRVFDTETQDYVFYQLYDIKEDKADWRIAGSGGSALLETVKINLLSNQGITDTDLLGTVVTIKYSDKQFDLDWSGTELSITVPMLLEYQIIPHDVAGYLTPEMEKYTSAGGYKRTINLVYSTEVVTVNVSTNDAADCSERTVQIVNESTSEIIKTNKGASFSIKVPFGINYKVSVDEFAGYVLPAEQSFTANSVARIISFEYEKIISSGITFDKSISDPANITGEINEGVIATILSKFRRCLCKKTGEGEVTIAFLKDTDSNYYEDGSPAKLDGAEGDVMVDFPEFYYKWEYVDENKYRYLFALHNDGTFKHVPRSLVGAYKGVVKNSKLYSISGFVPSVNVNHFNLRKYIASRGLGYQMIDFQQHNVIAFMLYAKYGTRDIPSILGRGGAEYGNLPRSGETNQFGNKDTENAKTGYVSGLGIEGVYGGIFEAVQGLEGSGTEKCKITDPDGVERYIEKVAGLNGSIDHVLAETGPFFDMIPTSTWGSYTTFYMGNFWQSSGAGRVCDRSGCFLESSNVSALSLQDGDSSATERRGSRLAFRGEIYEASSVSEFKALDVI